jgi:hypothetical protein
MKLSKITLAMATMAVAPPRWLTVILNPLPAAPICVSSVKILIVVPYNMNRRAWKKRPASA